LDESLTNMRVEPASTPEDDDATEVDSNDRAQTNEERGSDQRQLEPGSRFGIYEIRGVLGRGAMGVVYDAWDTTLERRVALKLLRWSSKRAAERLIREARALARLDHPNVVKIWAAGVHRGSLYIAMERVEGQNLRTWLETPRPWQQVLPVMLAAGRGLAAAHEARVVHRDFKPENVLVGWDGRARVVDFGIARIAADHPDHLTSSAEITRDGASSSHNELASISGFDLSTLGDLTEKGSLIGTVRYMSPEQHEREPADERSDQFAFCLTLFEAVYGRHPFPARTQGELAIKVGEGRVEYPEPLPNPAPPRWLRKLIVRGLAPDPRERHASMSLLVGELERHPMRRRARRQALAVAGVLAAAVAIALVLPSGRASDQVCLDVGHEVESRLGDAARSAITERYAALDTAWSESTATHVDTRLATWAGSWTEARTAVCERRHAHREATQLDERREACLAMQLDEVGALADVLREAEAGTLMNASRLLLALPDPRACLGDDPPQRPAAGEDAADIREQLVRLRWLAWGEGAQSGARERAAMLVNLARDLDETPEHGLLLAEVLLVTGLLDHQAGLSELAEERLRESIRLAERHGGDRVRAQATVRLGWLLVNTPGRVDEGHQRLLDAAALGERVGLDPLTHVAAAQAEGEALLARGELAKARARLEQLVDELEPKASDDPLAFATAIDALARVSIAARDHQGALDQTARAIAAIEGHLGASHPLLASPLNNAGLAHAGLGQHEEARASYARSIALRRKQLGEHDAGPGARRLAEVLVNLANLESEQGLPDAATHYDEALELLGEHDAATRAHVHYNLGVHHQIAGHHELSLSHYRDALRLALPLYPERSHEVAGARLGVGACLVALGRLDEGRDMLEQAESNWPSALIGTPDEAELRDLMSRVR
jgi:serine/threonine protein kinase/tetratricopeptide (TPR) repeat protein